MNKEGAIVKVNQYGESIDTSLKCTTCGGAGRVHSHNPVCWTCHGTGHKTYKRNDISALQNADNQEVL